MTTTTTRGAKQQVHHDSVHVDGLHPVGGRPKLSAYLVALWGRRHYIWEDSRARAASGTHGMALGAGWLALKPLLDAGVYLVIFGTILKTDRGIDNFIGYLLVGVLMFGFTARCLAKGANSLIAGRNFVRSFQFPRVSLPVATVLRETLNFVPGILTLMVLILAIPPHAHLSWRWGLFPAILALQIVFNMGIAMIAARLVSHIRDLKNLISFLTRFWLYGSAVFFSYDRFIEHPTVLALMKANPLFIVLDMTRDVLLYGRTPATASWLTLAAWATVACLVGFVYFWQAEDRYGND